MTNKERIEELERRVAELEQQRFYFPYWSIIPPSPPVWWREWDYYRWGPNYIWPPIVTVASGSTLTRAATTTATTTPVSACAAHEGLRQLRAKYAPVDMDGLRYHVDSEPDQ